jgi:hypothetical protein
MYFHPEMIHLFVLDVSFVSDPYLLLILLIYGTRGLHTAHSYHRCWTEITIYSEKNFYFHVLC